MPRKQLILPPVPVEFKCLNCDGTFEALKTAKLFCTTMCRDDAKLVRYFRACRKDGRLERPDVKQAIQIKFGFALSDLGYDEKSRKLSKEIRDAVFTRDKGSCRYCGSPGLEIDHIDGNSNELTNLQVLCQACHFRKTEERMATPDDSDERVSRKKRKYAGLMLRILADEPLRICDDDLNWEHQSLVTMRWKEMQTSRLIAFLPGQSFEKEDDDWIAEAMRRSREMDENAESVMTHEEFFASLRRYVA